MGEKIKWKLSEVNTRAVSKGQNEFIGKFKVAIGDVINTVGVTRTIKQII